MSRKRFSDQTESVIPAAMAGVRSRQGGSGHGDGISFDSPAKRRAVDRDGQMIGSIPERWLVI